MNILLWVLQILFGVYFFLTGVTHFTVPPGLPAPLAWMYELSPGLHAFSGAAEILGGLGLILPAVTRIQTRLVPLAALGLALVMAGAAFWHIPRGEVQNIAMNVVVGIIAVFIAYGRWKLSPLKDRAARG
ncbi:MAG: DoxX family protein [Chloroflexi bacterium]|nr:DoxX family protein [Chloroflexota bacterium]